MLSEDLGALVNPLNCTSGCAWIVRGDVLEDVFEPPESLVSPRYLGHDRMRRPISSFEMVRFASESARPRSIMTWNASSRTISSGELSSGWLWIRRVRSSFGVDMFSPPQFPYRATGGRTSRMTSNDRVERPTTMKLPQWRASFLGRAAAAHDLSRSARTRCWTSCGAPCLEHHPQCFVHRGGVGKGLRDVGVQHDDG